MFILSLVALLSAVVGPYIGHHVDAGKGRLWCLIAIIMNGIGVGSVACAEHLPIAVVAAALVCFFISLTIFGIISSILIEGNVPVEIRQQVSSYWAVGVNTAMAVSGGIAYYFIERHQTTLLVLDFFTTAIYAAYVAKRLKPGYAKPNPPPFDFRHSILTILACPLISIGSVALFLSLFIQMYVFPALLKTNGLDYLRITPLMGTVNNLIVIGMGPVVARGIFLKTLKSKISVFFISTTLGFALMPFAPTAQWILIYTLIWSLGEILIYPITSHLAFSSIPQVGLAASVKMIWSRLAQTIAPVFAIAVTASSQPLWQSVLLVVPLLLGALALIVTLRTNPQS